MKNILLISLLVALTRIGYGQIIMFEKLRDVEDYLRSNGYAKTWEKLNDNPNQSKLSLTYKSSFAEVSLEFLEGKCARIDYTFKDYRKYISMKNWYVEYYKLKDLGGGYSVRWDEDFDLSLMIPSEPKFSFMLWFVEKAMK